MRKDLEKSLNTICTGIVEKLGGATTFKINNEHGTVDISWRGKTPSENLIFGQMKTIKSNEIWMTLRFSFEELESIVDLDLIVYYFDQMSITLSSAE